MNTRIHSITLITSAACKNRLALYQDDFEFININDCQLPSVLTTQIKHLKYLSLKQVQHHPTYGVSRISSYY